MSTHTQKGSTLHTDATMTNTMTMQEQIQMLGFKIMSSSSLSLSLSQLQWNPSNQWSLFLGRRQEGQSCVIVSGNGAHPCENDAAASAAAQAIVVLGG